MLAFSLPILSPTAHVFMSASQWAKFDLYTYVVAVCLGSCCIRGITRYTRGMGGARQTRREDRIEVDYAG